MALEGLGATRKGSGDPERRCRGKLLWPLRRWWICSWQEPGSQPLAVLRSSWRRTDAVDHCVRSTDRGGCSGYVVGRRPDPALVSPTSRTIRQVRHVHSSLCGSTVCLGTPDDARGTNQAPRFDHLCARDAREKLRGLASAYHATRLRSGASFATARSGVCSRPAQGEWTDCLQIVAFFWQTDRCTDNVWIAAVDMADTWRICNSGSRITTSVRPDAGAFVRSLLDLARCRRRPRRGGRPLPTEVPWPWALLLVPGRLHTAL
jgi:hypothetical protein